MSIHVQEHNEPSLLPRKNTLMTQNIHFCVIVNQWCRGLSASGKPDDCINCGRCAQQPV
ncbi:MAG: hypothetical protein HXX11_05940 [Desulfuromonadales bacterium]|nr:hypothetical protein [Desulfuromonadales bacterium]